MPRLAHRSAVDPPASGGAALAEGNMAPSAGRERKISHVSPSTATSATRRALGVITTSIGDSAARFSCVA